MSRTPDEWIGADDDTAIPPRVRLRVWERAAGRCQICGRKIMLGDSWQADHIVALINGGENRESNLRVACGWCHRMKTKEDVAEKSAVYRKKAKHIGAAAPKRPWHPGWKRKMNGTAERISE